jgi:hypothetical protein
MSRPPIPEVRPDKWFAIHVHGEAMNFVKFPNPCNIAYYTQWHCYPAIVKQTVSQRVRGSINYLCHIRWSRPAAGIAPILVGMAPTAEAAASTVHDPQCSTAMAAAGSAIIRAVPSAESCDGTSVYIAAMALLMVMAGAGGNLHDQVARHDGQSSQYPRDRNSEPFAAVRGLAEAERHSRFYNELRQLVEANRQESDRA